MQVIRACLPLYELRFLSGRFGSMTKKPCILESVSRCILLVFLEVKLPQAHLLSSASHFHFFSFNSTFRFAILNCFIPAEAFYLAFRHASVYIRVPLPHPANNPINPRAPSLGPRLSLFSEVSYWICVLRDVYKQELVVSAHVRDARMVIPWTSKLQLPLLNSKSCNRMCPFKWKPPNMIYNLCYNINHTKNYLT